MASASNQLKPATPTAQPPHSIDVAILAFDQNIRRNSRAAVFEIIAVVSILLLIGFALMHLAQMQGQENDRKLKDLRLEESNSIRMVDVLSNERQELELDVARAAVVAKNAKPDSDEAQRAALLQVKSDRLAERYKAAVERRDRAADSIERHDSPMLVTEKVFYGSIGLTVVLLSILVGLYRHHMRETTRNEQLRIGFHRIRIAADNATTPGFDSEVRIALTSKAFEVDTEPAHRFGGRVKSPLPGHPSSDISANILNRLFEKVDIVLQPKVR